MASSRQNRKSPGLFSAAWVVLLAACAGAEPKGPNRACFRALDCQGGLVCVEGRCTDDIGPIVPEGAGTPVVPGANPPPPAADAGAY